MNIDLPSSGRMTESEIVTPEYRLEVAEGGGGNDRVEYGIIIYILIFVFMFFMRLPRFEYPSSRAKHTTGQAELAMTEGG